MIAESYVGKYSPIYIRGIIKDVNVYHPVVNKDGRGWLAEIYRSDEILPEIGSIPSAKMAYLSNTKPRVIRGPHEHIEQTDVFVFITGKWRVRLWDKRPFSPSFGVMQTVLIDKPTRVTVPAGIVHAYANASKFSDGMVINMPDRLYRGYGKADRADEIRHEGSHVYEVANMVESSLTVRIVNALIGVFKR